MIILRLPSFSCIIGVDCVCCVVVSCSLLAIGHEETNKHRLSGVNADTAKYVC